MTTLYHYTNAAGLIGILDSKSLWASDYRFLNDTSEFRYGWKIVTSEVQRHKRKIKSISADAWETLELLLAATEQSGVFALVASLTSEGDLLSQWRGYNGGKGYSVGINEDWLNQNADSQQFSLFPVVYSQQKQHNAAAVAVRLLLNLLDEGKNNSRPGREVVNHWWEHALKVALACKDKSRSKKKGFMSKGLAWSSV